MILSERSRCEKCWQAFKTIVYSTGYTGACYFVFLRIFDVIKPLMFSGSDDLVTWAIFGLIFTWSMWTIGVVCIIIDGMQRIRGIK